MAYSPYFSSWGKGELSPQLFGRSDVEQYEAAAAELTNCLVRPYGNVLNRPGSQYIAATKYQDKDTRLLEFIFSETDAYVLEFGEFYFRFYTQQASVLIDAPAAWITATAYVVGDFVEESGTNYYCIEAHTSGVFATDLAANKWVAQDVYEVPHVYAEADLRAVQYVQNKDVIYMVHPDYPTHKLSRFGADDWVFEEVDFIGGAFLDTNADDTKTLQASATTGSITVTAAGHSPFLPEHVGSYWSIGGTVGTDPAIQGYVIVTSYISATQVNADVIEELSTVAATDEWAEGAWSEVRGYPSTVTFDKRRLALGATPYEPQKLWESKPFIYDDFSVGDLDDDAINIEVSSDQSNSFRWLSPGNVLAIGTFGGEFVVSSGTQGETLTPTNVNAQPQSTWGSEAIQPRRISNFTYYVQRGGRKLRELYYFWDLDTYKSADVTIYSEHITESGIVELVYQQNPDSIVWALLANGKLACLTRETDQLIQAWTSVTTDGLYKSIASIPNAAGESYDEVWTIVDRTINGSTAKYIEFFHNQIAPDDQQECFYVDSGLCYNAYALTAGIGLTLSAVTGTGVTVTAGSAYFDPTMVGRRIKAYIDGTVVGDLEITAYTSDTVVTGTVRLDFNSLTYNGGEWGVSVTTLSGLDHLEGEEIVYLADGGVENFDNRLTVASGAITMNSDYFYVCVGKPYESYLVTLPLDFGLKTGTAIGQKKRINQIGAKFYRSLGVEYGANKTTLFKFTTRSVATELGTPEQLYTGEYNGQLFQGTTDYLAQITIAQRRPLPMNLLAIMPIEVTHNK